VLAKLGRTHSSRVALDAVAAARRAGVGDLNIDLIYGSPWEREDDWRATLAGAIESDPDHVAAYALTVETGTPLHTLVATGRLADVDPDVQAERHGIAAGLLEEAGFRRYEISNWARPGRASAHNVLYWCAGEYLGFGAGAHGHLDGRRYWAVRLPREWIARADAGAGVEAGSERLDDDSRAGEALMLGLRLASGVDPSGFVERFGADAWTKRLGPVAALQELGLLEASSGRIRLTERGTLVGNEVGARLL
jgi:coproporphyrinogen III oxidase-like Fe-S oxidoreductase